jgi:hypothetical protein
LHREPTSSLKLHGIDRGAVRRVRHLQGMTP